MSLSNAFSFSTDFTSGIYLWYLRSLTNSEQHPGLQPACWHSRLAHSVGLVMWERQLTATIAGWWMARSRAAPSMTGTRNAIRKCWPGTWEWGKLGCDRWKAAAARTACWHTQSEKALLNLNWNEQHERQRGKQWPKPQTKYKPFINLSNHTHTLRWYHCCTASFFNMIKNHDTGLWAQGHALWDFWERKKQKRLQAEI